MRDTWRTLRFGPVLMITTIALWLYVYLPIISTDKAVGIASSVIGAVFLFLCLGGYA